MADLFTNLAAQTLGTALLIEPLVPAQLAAASLASVPSLAVTDHASAFEHETQPNLDRPLSLPPQPASPSQPDHTLALREVNTSALRPGQQGDLPALARSELEEHQTNPVIPDNVYTPSPSRKHREAALAIHPIDMNVSHQLESPEVGEVSSPRVSAPAPEHVTGPRSISTAPSASDLRQQVRSSERQALPAHEPSTWLVPLQRSSDVTRRISEGYFGEERKRQTRLDPSTIEAKMVKAQINEHVNMPPPQEDSADRRISLGMPLNDRTFTLPTREDSSGRRTSIGTPTDAQTSGNKTAVHPRADRSHDFTVAHEDQINTHLQPALLSWVVQPEQTRHDHALVQPRVEPLLEALRLGAHPARQMLSDHSTRPTIHVSIGRVEVRGTPSTAPMPKHSRSTSSRPRLSLNDYLRQRRGVR